MFKQFLEGEKKNLDFKVWLQKCLFKHWFKMRMIELKHFFTHRVTRITRMDRWQFDGDVMHCYTEWKKVPRWSPFWFSRTYRGFMVGDWPTPIEASRAVDAVEIYAERMRRLDNGVAIARRLLEQLEQATANLHKRSLGA